MKHITRRNFLKKSMAAGMAISLPVYSTSCSKSRGANEQIRVAVIGIRGKGSHHISMFQDIPNVKVVALCDVDKDILAKGVAQLAEKNLTADTYTDLRKVLDRKDIDAISIATPNHWHSLATIWACQAGKDVYVEKPISHNIFEGRKTVEAARKYKRIVQSGTQNRSDAGLPQAIQYIKEGHLGKILFARGLCYKTRLSIGKVDGPQPIPKSIDYDLWTGPAPMQPLMRKKLHYDWHWVWPTGNGDIGNQGVHEMDICRWFIDQPNLPPKVMSIGERFGYIDDGQTPNTQIALFDYKPAPIIFEVRGLPRKKGEETFIRSTYRGIDVGVVIHCQGGYFNGSWVYDNKGNKIKQFIRDGGGEHVSNFIKAVRTRKVSDLNADILKGHISSTLCHMANISHRIGSQATPDQIKEAVKGNDDMLETFDRFKEHLVANEVDLNKTKAILGPTLQMNPKTETFKGTLSKEANKMLSRNYREPFVVPKKV